MVKHNNKLVVHMVGVVVQGKRVEFRQMETVAMDLLTYFAQAQTKHEQVVALAVAVMAEMVVVVMAEHQQEVVLGNLLLTEQQTQVLVAVVLRQVLVQTVVLAS
jgi:hypothetical protein